MNSSLCFIWLALPPIIHCHNVSFDGLSGGVVKLQVFEPGFVFRVTEGINHVVFQPLIVAARTNQQLSWVKCCRSLALKSCFNGGWYSRWRTWSFRCLSWYLCLVTGSSWRLVGSSWQCSQSSFQLSYLVLRAGISLSWRGPSLQLVSNLFCQTLDSFSFLQCLAILKSLVLCQFVKVNSTTSKLR